LPKTVNFGKAAPDVGAARPLLGYEDAAASGTTSHLFALGGNLPALSTKEDI
jgi:hypothetical protein